MAQSKVTPQSLLIEMFLTRWWMRIAIVTLAFVASCAALTSLFLQKRLLDQLTQTLTTWPAALDPIIHFLPTSSAALIVTAVILLFVSLAAAHLLNYLAGREAVWMQGRFSQRLYGQTLKLRTDTLHGRNVGELVSVYTTDIPGATILIEQSLPQTLSIVFPLVLAPPLLALTLQTDITWVLALMAFVMLLNLGLAYRQSLFFFLFKRLAADRTGLVQEWVQNMRVLRVLGWVAAFERKILNLREIETANRIEMLTNGQTMNAVASSITFVFNVLMVALVIGAQKVEVTPGILLSLFWIVGVFLTRPFRQMPWLFTFLFDGWTSLTRLAEILSLSNEENQARSPSFQKLTLPLNTSAQPILSVTGLNLEIRGKRILDDVSFDLKSGEFVAIAGPVGAGKSMLLLSLLGESNATFYRYRLGENDARTMNLDQLRQFYTFVPQEGFIMSASLRDNVAFDYGVPESADLEILRHLQRAQFVPDQERLAEGLSTEIGERGVNLSGGQRQRVSLARVDYYQSPLLLLDDSLSAVDVETEKRLMEGLITGVWKHRTRLMVTHRLSVLPKADRVLYLQNGKLVGNGSHAKLLKSLPDYRSFVASLEREELAKKKSAFLAGSDALLSLQSATVADSEHKENE